MIMDIRLTQALNGDTENCILPFFWQTGDTKDKLETEMNRIANCGIKAVCLESRTHEQFCEEKWFDDFAFILATAKKYDMKVWLLDDKHFPSGYANGKIASDFQQHRQWHIIQNHVDVVGPFNGAVLLNSAGEDNTKNERTLIAALAVKREQKEEIFTEEVIDVTNCISGDFLYWNVPNGCYRIFTIYKTREGSFFQNYIDMISEESVDVLINEVYEKHYARFKDEFGDTFVGFFSDEPCFANGISGGRAPRMYDYNVGIPNVAYPWRDDFIEEFSKEFGKDAVRLLPALWYPMGDRTAAVRLKYMGMVTKAYRDCFSRRIGDWCRKHNVQYIGHIIEDMGCHAHLGPGAGHYFRALDGQDMAGIDVVLQQIMPGMSHFVHSTVAYGGFVEPQFFDYVLAKLASSLAHLHPRMNGRAMCEMYGAYGWAEGVPFMKWLTDHMLVRGINHFVPHAFTTKYPNFDCPPHFYAGGHYNQYRDFAKLMDYTNRMSHILRGGKHIVSVALLYDAEFEWCGCKRMKMQEPAEALYDAHIDYDIVPIDYILSDSCMVDGKLVINEEEFKFLVIPYTEIIPFDLYNRLIALKDRGLQIYFAGGLPSNISNGNDTLPFNNEGFVELELNELPDELIKSGASDIRVLGNFPLLRCLHIKRQNYDYFMLFNESFESVDTDVFLPCIGSYMQIDMLNENLVPRFTEDGKVRIKLEIGQSVVLAFDKSMMLPEKALATTKTDEVCLDGTYNISGKRMMADKPEFELVGQLFDVTSPNNFPDFTGIITYETDFKLPQASKYILNLGEVGETAVVYINGEKAAHLICNPYTADITDFVKLGDNKIKVEVANSMVYSHRDEFSKQVMAPRSGLLGLVKIDCYQN